MKKVLFLMVMLTAFAVAETDPELNPPVSDIQSSVETATEVSDPGQDMVPPGNEVPGDATSADNVSQNGNYPSESNSTEEQQPATCLGGGGFMSFLPMIAIIAIFYFLMIRPQQKQAKRMKAMREAMKISDKVVTAGGIHGVITNIKGEVATVRIADGVKIDVDKTSLSVEGETTGNSCCST